MGNTYAQISERQHSAEEKDRAFELAKQSLEEATRANIQPEDGYFPIHENDLRADWERLYPICAALRALPARPEQIKDANKWYKVFRRHASYYGPDCVMREQTRSKNTPFMGAHELLCIARALRKDHSEIDVMKLNPKDVALAFIPKKDRVSHDWTGFNRVARAYGYIVEENGVRLPSSAAPELPEPARH